MKEEEEVGILLEFALIRKMAFRGIDILEMSFDFVLLGQVLRKAAMESS